MLNAAPNIRPAETCFGIWSTVLAEKTLAVRATRSNTRPYTSPARLCALGLPRYTASASAPCSATIAERRASISSNASSHVASRHSAPERIWGHRMRSGSDSSARTAVPLGQRYP